MSAILYLHGFLSSPLSVKAQQTRAYLAEHHPDIEFICPELSNHPAELSKQLLSLITANPVLTDNGLKVIGSSMGGYLATWLMAHFNGKAALINPAVKPFELLEGYLGAHINPYTQKQFTLSKSDIEHIRRLYVPHITNPANFKVLLQTGDETLDYRLAVQHYQGAEVVVEEGGDHSFVDYEQHLPAIAAFLFSA
ncbi:esterase YqiA [Aestuariibacter sp. GS-14]|uniref:YqiA/YcfP family alpha/beta fold hydrolase n=1 Tax=Aestuariibacter sp. GS-14 TaxID=2590670 RepID=UPI00112C29C1|nr:YqiA/YcfP family alpha/beta fold hydrolase [Aestuariibacter sp. GS-14]TPV55090.1 esterase YqiA [Aestuariibacter sp. GS-14]